ncbi:hypothetical protein ACFL1M_04890 [Patescibacteria group bacterium]
MTEIEPDARETNIDDTLKRIFEQDEKIVQTKEEKLAILKDPAYVAKVIEKSKARKAEKEDDSSNID